jgi:hypothetical protein
MLVGLIAQKVATGYRQSDREADATMVLRFDLDSRYEVAGKFSACAPAVERACISVGCRQQFKQFTHALDHFALIAMPKKNWVSFAGAVCP